MQEYDSIMCGYFCLGFFDFMPNNKRQTQFTNPFSPILRKVTKQY